jgi:hypothetical protein
MRVLMCALAMNLLAGCASAPAPTAAPLAAPANDAVAIAATDAAVSTRAAAPPGYKRVERDGATLLCTTVASLGTRFKKDVCMTQDEYDEVVRRGESVRQDLRQSTKICGGGSGISSCNGS